MANQEELNALKEKYETLNRKLRELSEEELKQATGGANVRNSDGTIKYDNTRLTAIDFADETLEYIGNDLF